MGETQQRPHVRGPERREGPGLVEVDDELQLVWVPGPHVRESKRRESSGLFAAAVEVQLLWARLSKGPHVRETERRALRARLSKGSHEREPERREGSQAWLTLCQNTAAGAETQQGPPREGARA